MHIHKHTCQCNLLGACLDPIMTIGKSWIERGIHDSLKIEWCQNVSSKRISCVILDSKDLSKTGHIPLTILHTTTAKCDPRPKCENQNSTLFYIMIEIISLWVKIKIKETIVANIYINLFNPICWEGYKRDILYQIFRNLKVN